MEKQLTQEEIQQIQKLQNQIKEVSLQLGSIEVKKIQLKDFVLQLRNEEEKIAKNLSDKYGNGTLDIETGKLTILDNK
jgi:septal ring factor EnvC (AmiA/AmiB activator)